MRKSLRLIIVITIYWVLTPSCHQPSPADYSGEQKEIQEFMDHYALLIQHARFDSVGLLYVEKDFISSGMGNQEVESIDSVKANYARMPRTPVDFRWEKMRIDILSKNAALVTALYYWHNQNEPDTIKESYTGVFVKSGKDWLIKHEHESVDIKILARLLKESEKNQ